MKIVRKILTVAWFASAAGGVICMLVACTAGREAVPDVVAGINAATFCLTFGLLFLVGMAGESDSDGLDRWLVRGLFSIGPFALGVVYLSADGRLLPETLFPWAVGVFVTWLALLFLGVVLVLAAEKREARTNDPADASPRPPQGWTPAQLALVMMLFGALTVLWMIKCLVFGPPPYSSLAYVIGPCLLVTGYLVDPHAIRNFWNEIRKPPGSSAPGGG